VKHDADLERDLANWLEETAQPMADMLAESIAAVPARHGQAGARTRPAWLSRALLASALTATAVVVAIVGPAVVDRTRSLLGGPPAGQPTFSWDAMINFREAPNQLNPSPDAYGNPNVWSYLRSRNATHDPDEYVPLADFEPAGENNWSDAAYTNLFVGWARGDDRLTLHPWGGLDDVRAVIVAWRSPIDGEVSVRGDVEADATCGDGTILSIDQGATTLATLSVGSAVQSFAVTAEVRAGESLYFRVDPGSNSNCDTTWLRVVIEG
jgi:hypothetical protein